MSGTSFEKPLFSSHRDWEESLVKFLASEARSPNVNNWVSPDGSHDVAAAFSALLLSNLLEPKPGFRESSSKLRDIYKTLSQPEWGAKKFEEWLRSGWVNVNRVANMLDVELRHATNYVAQAKATFHKAASTMTWEEKVASIERMREASAEAKRAMGQARPRSNT